MIYYGSLVDAEGKIVDIIKKIESGDGLPKGVLTDVYDEEKMQIHLDNRRNLTAPLRELVMKYYSKQNETKKD